MEYQDIRVAQDEGIATVTLDRGDGRNALRPQGLREICAALDALIDDPSVRAIVLTGAGKHFTAGADFEFLQGLPETPAMRIRDQIYSAFQGAARRIWGCPKPTIAAINGAAITVGCELALACDFRIIGPSAVFQESWIRLGIIPPLGGLYLLPRIVGLALAKEIALSGRAVEAAEALRIGLATRSVAAPEDLARAAQDFARELAGLPPLAFRAAKEAIHRGLDTSMESEWSSNVLAQSLLLGSDDFREGLAAVMERRPGRFTGH